MTDNLDSIKKSIQEKSKEGITAEDLAELRTQMGCLSKDSIAKLRIFFSETFSKNQKETRDRLNALLMECTPVSESKESKELHTSSFQEVFAGTRSELFAPENIKAMSGMIDDAFNGIDAYKNLPESQKENIRIAMTDRLLKDGEIQKLFGMKLGIVDIFGHLAKGEVTEAMDTDKAKKAGDQGQKIIATLHARMAVATKPLSELLQKNTVKPSVFLSNPSAIAAYNGGEIRSDIRDMDPSDLQQYISGLNADVRKIDAKIFPMEEIKEKGMNFLAGAPSFLVELFKWLLSFDFLAKLLGYRDSKEASESIGDELRQRKSLNILREFGRVTDVEGKQRDGESSGKIDILKGKDLSNISRKKLWNFFKFTKEEGIDSSTSGFWMGIFNDGKIVMKNEKGEHTEHRIEAMKSADIEKDFEGMYAKLNKLFTINNTKKTEAEDKSRAEVLQAEVANKKSEQESEQKRLAREKERLTIREAKLNPFLSLSESHIDAELMKQLADINLQNLSDGGYRAIAQKVLIDKKYDSHREKILADLTTLWSVVNGLIRDNKLENFKKQYQNQSTEKFDIWLENVYRHREELLAALGYTSGYLAVVPKELVALNQKMATTSQSTITETQKPISREDSFKQALKQATRLPFEFGEKKEKVSFEDGKLQIGNAYFEMKGKGAITVDITSVTMEGDDILLEHAFGKIALPKTQMMKQWIGPMLILDSGKTIEVAWESGKLIITRIG